MEGIAYLGEFQGRRQFMLSSQLSGSLFEVRDCSRRLVCNPLHAKVSVGNSKSDTKLVRLHKPLHMTSDGFKDVADLYYSPASRKLYVLYDKMDELASFDVTLGDASTPSILKRGAYWDLTNLKGFVSDQEGVTMARGMLYLADDACRTKNKGVPAAKQVGCLISLPFAESAGAVSASRPRFF